MPRRYLRCRQMSVRLAVVYSVLGASRQDRQYRNSNRGDLSLSRRTFCAGVGAGPEWRGLWLKYRLDKRYMFRFRTRRLGDEEL